MEKKEFVENCLYPTVKAIFPQVQKLIYQKYDDPKFHKWEAVYVEYDYPEDSLKCGGVITVDVSADSLLAIAEDVLKKLDNKL